MLCVCTLLSLIIHNLVSLNIQRDIKSIVFFCFCHYCFNSIRSFKSYLKMRCSSISIILAALALAHVSTAAPTQIDGAVGKAREAIHEAGSKVQDVGHEITSEAKSTLSRRALTRKMVRRSPANGEIEEGDEEEGKEETAAGKKASPDASSTPGAGGAGAAAGGADATAGTDAAAGDETNPTGKPSFPLGPVKNVVHTLTNTGGLKDVSGAGGLPALDGQTETVASGPASVPGVPGVPGVPDISSVLEGSKVSSLAESASSLNAAKAVAGKDVPEVSSLANPDTVVQALDGAKGTAGKATDAPSDLVSKAGQNPGVPIVRDLAQ
jgi:hypothetical protein